MPRDLALDALDAKRAIVEADATLHGVCGGLVSRTRVSLKIGNRIVIGSARSAGDDPADHPTVTRT